MQPYLSASVSPSLNWLWYPYVGTPSNPASTGKHCESLKTGIESLSCIHLRLQLERRPPVEGKSMLHPILSILPRFSDTHVLARTIHTFNPDFGQLSTAFLLPVLDLLSLRRTANKAPKHRQKADRVDHTLFRNGLKNKPTSLYPICSTPLHLSSYNPQRYFNNLPKLQRFHCQTSQTTLKNPPCPVSAAWSTFPASMVGVPKNSALWSGVEAGLPER